MASSRPRTMEQQPTATHQMVNAFNILGQMRKDNVLCDVILTVKNIEIAAHRAVLAASSRYFYAQFTNVEYAKTERIELDVDPQALLALINYMYTSKITLTDENVKVILPIAKMLLLDSAQEDCCEYIIKMLCPENCLSLKAFVSTQGSAESLKAIDRYIDNQFSDVVNFKEFTELPYKQLTAILNRNTLTVPSEETIYQCTMAWIKHDLKARRKYLRALMRLVRLTLIPKEYIKQHIRAEPLLNGDVECKDMIIDALLGEGTSDAPTRRYSKDLRVLVVIGRDSDTAEYYDFETMKWTKISNTNVYLQDTTFASFNSNIYEIGLSRKTKNYNLLTTVQYEYVSMNQARTNHGAVVLNQSIYVVGGYVNGYLTSKVERFDITTKAWTSVSSIPTPRSNFGIAVLDGLIYVIGGRSDGYFDDVLSSTECYNPETNTWKSLAYMTNSKHSIAAGVLDGVLYAVGGCDDDDLNIVEAYQPQDNKWTLVAPMNTYRCCATAASLNGKLYVVGGQSNGRSLNSVEVYEPKNNTWSIMSSNMNNPRSMPGVTFAEKPNEE